MKSIEIFVSRYDDDHKSLLSRLFRGVAIVLLNLGVMCLLWSLPDQAIKAWMGDRIFSNWATVYAVLLILYYGSESFSLTFGGGFFLLGLLFGVQWVSVSIPEGTLLTGLALVGVALFLFLVGRLLTKSVKYIYKDFIYLPVQPVWLLSFLYRWMGIKI